MKRLTENPAVPLIALAALVAIGAVIRFIVAGQDLFADELATYWVVKSNSLPDAIETVATNAEISPPLGFILTWLTTPVSSRLDITLAPELIRLPAIVAGLASIPLVYLIGTRTVGRGAALLAAALTTLAPFMIFYSTEARGYGVMMALVLLSTLMLLLALDRGRPGWWVGYGVAICLAAYTHYTSVFVLAAQAGWVLWAHPGARKPLLISTGVAALLYIPWLPSMKADLDSPTTDILDALSPFNVDTIALSIGHWSIGFPFAGTPLTDIPGIPGLVLISAAFVVGLSGLYATRGRLKAWFAVHDHRIVLVVLLALATPVAEAAVSLIGTNVFSTRNLAASWPYLALAFAALITVGSLRLRLVASALAIAGMSIAAATVPTTDYQRPHFSDVAEFVSDGSGGVLVDGAALTPGPLTNFEVVGSQPDVEVLRLNRPEQRSEPFRPLDQLTPPSEIASRAVAGANGGPITVTSEIFPDASYANPIAEDAETSDLVAEFIDELPPGYELAERRIFPGLVDLQILVFERTGTDQQP